MKFSKTAAFATLAMGLAMAVSFAQPPSAATTPIPETVTVGDAGNKDDSTGFGGVAYTYKIGKYEVNNTEYCAFLNAVAKSDPHQLYDTRMGSEELGGISRTGDEGKYAYSLKEGMAKKPVGWLTVMSMFRYCNWLSNGGGNADTETGPYVFKDGDVKTYPDHPSLATGATVKYVMPTENEWYKAAYYDAKKPGGAGYWLYANKSDTAPDGNIGSGGPTDGGKYAPSAYGTYDQNGNEWEYNEAHNGPKFGLRGGSYYLNDNEGYARNTTRYDEYSAKWPHYGFRIAALGGAAAK